MALKKKISCLWTLGLCLVASKSSDVPTIEDRHFINQCVSVHNQLRGQVKPPAADMNYMDWDSDLAKLAEAWANKCIFGHNICIGKPYECSNDFQYVGENIWLGGLRGFTPGAAITDWYNETAFYDFDSLSCSKVCGHYTQDALLSLDTLQGIRTDVTDKEYGLATVGKIKRMEPNVRYPDNKQNAISLIQYHSHIFVKKKEPVPKYPIITSEMGAYSSLVVWANSYKVGCAISICPHLSGPSTAIFVCNYGPAGNFANMHPYTKGASCSMCSEGKTCVKNLCRTPKIVIPNKDKDEKPVGKAPQSIAYNLLSLGSVLLRIL